jgi:hypothetical protein
VEESRSKHWFAFGAGSRAYTARNLDEMESYMAIEKIVENHVLEGAKVCRVRVEIYQ